MSNMDIEEPVEIDEKQHAYELMQKMNSYRNEDRRHCDFTIKVGREEIPVHKNVLSAASDYFKAMLSHDTIETRSSFVEIKEIEPDCVKKCINFMYTGKAAVSRSNRRSLMHAAHMLQLQKLCDAIAVRLKDNLDCESFFDVKNLATMYNVKELGKACDQFAMKNFRDIAQCDEFMKLDPNYISFLIQSKDTKASEAVKCKIMLEWIAHDSSRKKLLVKFVKKLDLKKISLSQRRFLVENEPLVYESADCLKLFTVSILDTLDVKPKEIKTQQKKKTIAVFNKSANTLDAFDPEDGALTTLTNLDDKIRNKGSFSAVEMEGFIYVMFNDKTCFRISCDDFTWEQLANKNLFFGSATVMGGIIYTIQDGKYSASVESYDLTKNTWSMILNRLTASAFATLTATDDGVYCIGGHTHSPERAVSQVEFYNPLTSSWSIDSQLNTARFCATTAVFETKIFAMGGYGNYGSALSSVEVRCPTTKVWTILSPMNYARVYFKGCIIDEKMYAVGGDRHVEEYDFVESEWKECGDLGNIDIEGLGTVAITL